MLADRAHQRSLSHIAEKRGGEFITLPVSFPIEGVCVLFRDALFCWLWVSFFMNTTQERERAAI